LANHQSIITVVVWKVPPGAISNSNDSSLFYFYFEEFGNVLVAPDTLYNDLSGRE